MLAPGKVADIAIFDGTTHKDYRAVIDAEPQDVALVHARAARCSTATPTLVDALADAGAATRSTCAARTKQVCLTGEIGKTLRRRSRPRSAPIYPRVLLRRADERADLRAARARRRSNGSTIYTGVADAPTTATATASPTRRTTARRLQPDPPDGQRQAGRRRRRRRRRRLRPVPARRRTPTTCTDVDPNDSDGDGMPNATDNCPDVANPDQADTDRRRQGRRLRRVPDEAEPGRGRLPGDDLRHQDETALLGRPSASPTRSSRDHERARHRPRARHRASSSRSSRDDAGYIGDEQLGRVRVRRAGRPVLVVGRPRRCSNPTTVTNFHGADRAHGRHARSIKIMDSPETPAPAGGRDAGRDRHRRHAGDGARGRARRR